MKIVKISMFLAVAAAVIFGLGTTSFAFHSGGVAECMGCHNIHDGKSTSSLLIAQDVTSTCANASCHGSPSRGSYHILTPQSAMSAGVPPLNSTPGGDFGWLLKTYTWSPRSGSSETEEGFEHGHNVVALDLTGYVADGVNTAPPGGGTMDATVLSCNSCHDQHGKQRILSDGTVANTGAPIVGSGSYTNSAAPAAGQAVGAYRLLRGSKSVDTGSGGTAFTADFYGVVASTYNKYEGTDGRTAMAYGKGVSDWCATCHPDMLSATTQKHTHPVNAQFDTALAANYNAYLGSGLTGNEPFDTFAPWANDNVTDLATLKADANNPARDASTTSRVMCLSCHRAHASGFAHAVRWQNENEFIWVDATWPGTDATGISTQAKYAMGRTQAETAAAYNKKSTEPTGYASYQRSLCNKCHAKD